MNLYENIKIALEGLRLNKMRSFLTMLGIIIGIASVITIVTMGEALTKSVSDGFEGFGNSLMAIDISPKENMNYQTIPDRDYLSMDDINQIYEKFESRISEVLIYGAGTQGSAVEGRENAQVSVSAVSPGEKSAFNLEILYGRFLEKEDIQGERAVCVISDKVLKKLYDDRPENILGKEIKVDTAENGFEYYYVVGIYKFKPISFGVLGGIQSDDMPTELYIPYTVGDSQFSDKDSAPNRYLSFSLLAKDRSDIPELSKEMEAYVNENFYKDSKTSKAQAVTLESQLSQIMTVMQTISLGIGGIAAISLLVGGIGVMNILLVSVTERTREIGIRKALGATNKDIRSQFIVESIIICIIGGIIGIILGSIAGRFASMLLQKPTLPPISAMIIAVSFSMLIE